MFRECIKLTMISAILAGGESRRMGTDKAALEIAGVSLLQRTVRTVQHAGQHAVVVGRAQPADWPGADAEFIPDDTPGLGPLGGLQTALHLQENVLALSCDLPLLMPDAVRWLGAQLGRGNEHGLIVVNDGKWEPLFSIYCRACLPLIETRLAEGRRSLYGLIEAGPFAFADAPDWVAAQLVNVNTPEQWQALRENKEH